MRKQKKVGLAVMRRKGGEWKYSMRALSDKFVEYKKVFDVWFLLTLKKSEIPFRNNEVKTPDDSEFPQAVAWLFRRCGIFRMWAYATHEDVDLSFSQVARALHTNPTPEKREELVKKGLPVREIKGRYYVSMAHVRKVLGEQVANRIVLYPSQIARLLGVAPSTAKRVVSDLGVAEPRTDIVVSQFGAVRHIFRTSVYKFDIPEKVKAKYSPYSPDEESDAGELNPLG